MEIVIDIEDSVPLFNQLVSQIKQAVANGNIESGEALPSIRQLANDLDINNKTVAKAYRMLERDSIIQTKGYRGTFIHPQAKEHCDIDLNEFANEKLTNVIVSLKEAGLTDSEIRISFGQIMSKQQD
ncbi:MAG: GntR family transcriptional regulator [Kangiellaceae bacterium]|nr:GntR family transcriptional regulator [Kangiellaceae bacterium]